MAHDRALDVIEQRRRMGLVFQKSNPFFMSIRDNVTYALRINGERNRSVLIVTHNMQQASRVSDDTAFRYQGQIVEYGPTAQLFTNLLLQETEDYITGRFG